MNDKDKLAKVRAELETIKGKIIDLQVKQRELRKKEHNLRSAVGGLVEGVTLVRSTRYAPTKVGAFAGYYFKYRSTNWINVMLLKKDGTIGKRKVIFYDWEKVS